MSNERNDSRSDPQVSDVYRELADERTPEHLNREVLRMAAREGKTRYSAMRAWIRPAAWAATIGLSLTLVLQLSDTPQPVPASTLVVAPAEQDRFEAKDNEQRRDGLAKRSRTQLQQGQPAEKISVLNDAPVAAGAAADDNTSMEAAATTRPIVSQDPETIPKSEPSAASVASDEQQATRVPAAAAFSAESTSLRSYADGLCPLETRETAENWFECIKAIENRAPRDLVDREYEEFWKRFPEFEDPGVDR